jgi:transposase
VIETGTHSPWVSRLLKECGHEVIVANARRIALISKSKKKTDREDCEILARLGRADPELLAPIEHRGEAFQLDLTVVRARSAAVRSRTQLINATRGLVKAVGERLPATNADRFHKLREVLPDKLRPALMPLLDQIEGLTETVREYDRRIEALCRRHEVTQHLREVQGVGPLTALAFVLTIEDPLRFSRSRQVGAYLGLVPRLDESGDSKPQLRITKAGDVDLRTLLVTASHYVLGPWGEDSDLRRWGLELAERGGKNGKKRAVVAVARRLAVLLHHLWRTGEVYDPLFLARQRGEAEDPDKARPPRTRKKARTTKNKEPVAV